MFSKVARVHITTPASCRYVRVDLGETGNDRYGDRYGDTAGGANGDACK